MYRSGHLRYLNQTLDLLCSKLMIDTKTHFNILGYMVTLDVSKPSFTYNPNQAGPTAFSLVKQNVAKNGKNVYIYERTTTHGRARHPVTSFEVFVPIILKAGLIKLPNGATKTLEEDTELYPGASLFGRSAAFCVSLKQAETKFQEMLGNPPDVDLTEEDDCIDVESVVVQEPVSETTSLPKAKRTPKAAQCYSLPDGEFTVQQLADHNKVSYPMAYIYLKSQVEAGTVKVVRKVKLNPGKGKRTNIYGKS